LNFGQVLSSLRRGEFESIVWRNSTILNFCFRWGSRFSIASVAICSRYRFPVMKRIARASLRSSNVEVLLFRTVWYLVQRLVSSWSILSVCIR